MRGAVREGLVSALMYIRLGLADVWVRYVSVR